MLLYSPEWVGFIYCLKRGRVMKMSARLLALTIAALFIGSTMTAFVGPIELEIIEDLEDEPIIEYASSATSPGHVVFGQYISSDNCGHCSKTGGGSDAHHAVKGLHPDEYVYITYMSSSYGDTDTARAGAVSPYNWAWSTGGAPDAYFGDRTDKNQGGASTNYDTYDTLFSSGGGMASTTNDYGMSASISQSGATYDIDISYKYTGTASPAGNMKLYAALVDEECTGYSYTSGIPHGYNCWMGWLTDSDTYKSKSSGTGTSFASVTPTATSQSQTWSSVPASVVPGGLSKAIVIGVLMSGNSVSVGGTSEHVYHAIDSTMGPKMDIGITNFALTNPSSSVGYMLGDSLTLDATVKNVGDLDYTDGGNLEFYYVENNVDVIVDTVSIGNLPIVGSTSMTASTTIDTTNFDASDYKKTFGAKLSGLVGDTKSSNNEATLEYNQNRPPETKNPQIDGEQSIERNSHAVVLAKVGETDFIDTIATTTFNVEISPSGLNQWFSSVVTGGESIVNTGSANEGREYHITPSASMLAGWYDVRTQAIDSRGQTGDWMAITGTSGFELENGVPTVIVDPIPSVLCDTATNVSMVGHIVDPETSLENILITSDDASFVAWHPTTQQIEVNFQWGELNGCPIGLQGLEINMDDGGDYSDAGELPHGTLKFTVTENGQPRWNGLPSQSVIEGGNGILALLPFLSDTDDTGAPSSVDSLTMELISNSNEEAIDAYLIGNTIGFDTVDADVNGQAILTIRASDGVKTSDATLTINIQPVNDAPRVIPFDDLENIVLKRNVQRVIAFSELIVDVDNPAAEAFVSVDSSEPGAARYSFLDGSLTLQFEETGMQTVTISVIDKYDTNVYVMNVEVYDSIPFLLSKTDDGSGYMFVNLEDTYIGQTPTATMMLTSSAPTFTSISATWNICSSLTGTCDGILEYELAVSESNSGWNKELSIPSVTTQGAARDDGSQYMDYYKLSIVASDGTDDYKTMTDVKWDIIESMPAVGEMEDEMFSDYLEDLTAEKTELMAQIESAAVGVDITALEVKLTAIEEDLDTACEDPRATCVDASLAGSDSTTGPKDMNMTLIGIIAGVVVLGLLLTLMITRRGQGDSESDNWNNTAWDPNMVPAQDSVANSMYGGAETLFQQPVAIPAAPQLAAPPLPPGGLPAGWTVEQWSYYGQQYLDGTL
jgi:hypothetical protein